MQYRTDPKTNNRISALGEDVYGEFIVKARAIGETV